MMIRDNQSLAFVVRLTLALLVLAALLVIVGIFNESLGWDIFGPRVEAALWAIFGSCLALAGLGVAMTLVLGIREIAGSFATLADEKAGRQREAPPPRAFRRSVAGLLALVATLVMGLSGVNHLIQRHRSQVFERLAAEQMTAFAPRLEEIVVLPRATRRGRPPHDLHSVLKSLEELSFIRKVTLYAFDPESPAALWRYSPGYETVSEHGFEKILVAKESDKAMRDFLAEQSMKINALNREHRFVRYHSIPGKDGTPIAVLRIAGNPRENFREYFMGS